MIAFILAAVSRQAGAYAIPGYGHARKGYQFLKKGALSLADESVRTSVELIRRIADKVPYPIMDEARRMYGDELASLREPAA